MKTRAISSLAAAGLLAASASAVAADQAPSEHRFYIAPMFSFVFPNDSQHPVANGGTSDYTGHSGNGWQLSLGKNFGNFFALELYAFDYDNNGNVAAPAATAGDNVKRQLTGYGASALFFPARDILPIYALVGGGFDDYDITADNNANMYDDGHHYDLGAGVMLPLNDYGIKVRAEYRYRHSKIDIKDDFGGGDETFRDNVVSVGLQIPLGKPAEAPAPAPAPVTPEPVAQPEPAEPAPIVLRGVTFEFDSAKLTAQAENRLNNVVAALDASPEVDFRIDGHTDSTGPAAYNQGLSERRAASVQDYLINHGIASDRITAVAGHGESEPVASNETKEGRAKNRRVELNVTNQ